MFDFSESFFNCLIIGFLDSEYNQETVQAMQSVKSSLDPNNILNPGKVLPDNNRPS
ncbi:hypothetical protein K0C01_10435 [Salinarchaeum sp. IM2453]|uniref:FAD-linked oxidase C-terminal domain-containing protein n=1 Tax=Salinarchaeum sp. IM2453 TaxID=2862870 RepID=UPI001C83A226|nr:hypothetical protein K0C01_10435 [Salinarchaeum sp. IM2453]